MASVDGPSGEQGHPNGVARQAAYQPRGCLGSLRGAHGEAEVADDVFSLDQSTKVRATSICWQARA
jgi:hypothetical protein